MTPMRLVCALALGLACAPLARGQTFQPPRLADGHPDLQGLWDGRTLTPVERPEGVDKLTLSETEAAAMATEMLRRRAADPKQLDPSVAEPDARDLTRIRGQYHTSMVVQPSDGRLPLTAAGEKLRDALRQPVPFDGPETLPLYERCIAGAGAAPFGVTSAGMFRQIVQTPEAILIHTEALSDVRIVRMTDRRSPVPAGAPMGDSIGHWDGDTLVVETTGGRADNIVHGGSAGQVLVRPLARVIERFTLVAPDELLYAFTVEDSDIYSVPWRGELGLRRSAVRTYEWACHEGNYSMTYTLRAGRDAALAAAAGKP